MEPVKRYIVCSSIQGAPTLVCQAHSHEGAKKWYQQETRYQYLYSTIGAIRATVNEQIPE